MRPRLFALPRAWLEADRGTFLEGERVATHCDARDLLPVDGDHDPFADSALASPEKLREIV